MPYGTLNADTITNSNGLSGNAIGPGFKNRIINGDMRIDQSNAGAAVNNTTSGPFTVDRWIVYGTADNKYSAQRSTTAPAGFVNSLLLTSLAATSVGTSDRYVVWQKIEGNNVSDFAWGSASAKTITVSFWARSSVTGTYGGCIVNSAGNRSYPFTYTISSANTYEYKTITITGDTTGTWLTDTGIGLYLQLAFGAGSTFSGTAGSWAAANYSSATGATNWISTNGATFYITGVQLEVGPSATSFDYRPYGTELMLCQRYYYSWSSSGLSDNYYFYSPYVSSPPNTTASVGYFFPVTMRANPTMVGTGLSLARFTANQAGAVAQLGTTSGATAYGLSTFTASAEL